MMKPLADRTSHGARAPALTESTVEFSRSMASIPLGAGTRCGHSTRSPGDIP